MHTAKTTKADDLIYEILYEVEERLTGQEFGCTYQAEFHIQPSENCSHMAAVCFKATFENDNDEFIGSGFVGGWDGADWKEAHLTIHRGSDHSNWTVRAQRAGEEVVISDLQRV